jgi:hypothetical protein
MKPSEAKHGLIEFLQTHRRTAIPGYGAVYEPLPWVRGSSPRPSRRLAGVAATIAISIALSSAVWWVM